MTWDRVQVAQTLALGIQWTSSCSKSSTAWCWAACTRWWRLGYTMVYGIIGLINFAHGEVLMVGALVSWSVIGLLQPLLPPVGWCCCCRCWSPAWRPRR